MMPFEGFGNTFNTSLIEDEIGFHVSHLANKDIKVLLTQCARSAVQYDK